MEVELFGKLTPTFTLQEAEDYVASFTTESYGCIWLHHANGSQLAIMINGDQAYPHFFPAGDHPGWQVAPDDDGDWDTMIDLLADNGEPTPMPHALIVPIDRALAILAHYWQHGSRIDSETWTSLIDDEP